MVIQFVSIVNFVVGTDGINHHYFTSTKHKSVKYDMWGPVNAKELCQRNLSGAGNW